MKTKILKFEEQTIEESVKLLENGGLIIYPTETSYGIGADATNEKAVEKIREIKGRSYNVPITIIVDSLERMKRYGAVTEKAERLVEKFMPGPLTIIVKKNRIVPDVLTQGGIGFRISSHPVAFSLSKKFKRAITSTSANVSGKGDVYDSKKLIELFSGKIDLIIDHGKIPKVKPSTVIDIRNKPKILREGSVSGKLVINELMRKKLNQLILADNYKVSY